MSHSARAYQDQVLDWLRARSSAANTAVDHVMHCAWDIPFLAAAAAHVARTHGAKTPGIDGETPQTLGEDGLPRLVFYLRRDLQLRTYRPAAQRIVRIPRAGAKPREISILTLRDRVVSRSLALIIGAVLEPRLDPSAAAYFPARGPAYGLQVAKHLVSSDRVGALLRIDFEDYFGSIEPRRALHQLAQHVSDLRLLRLVQECLPIRLPTGGTKRVGVPAGSALSCVTANLYRDAADRFARRHPAVVDFCAYADDILFGIEGDESDAAAFRSSYAKFVGKKLGLALADHKTSICTPEQGIRFLGHTIARTRHGATWIEPAGDRGDRLTQRLVDAMCGITARRKGVHQQKTEERVRAILDGFVAYYEPSAVAERIAEDALKEARRRAHRARDRK